MKRRSIGALIFEILSQPQMVYHSQRFNNTIGLASAGSLHALETRTDFGASPPSRKRHARWTAIIIICPVPAAHRACTRGSRMRHRGSSRALGASVGCCLQPIDGRENLRYYFTEPSARPPCQKRCSMRKTMITGTILTSAPARTIENNTLPPPPPALASWYQPDRPTVSGKYSGDRRTISGRK